MKRRPRRFPVLRFTLGTLGATVAFIPGAQGQETTLPGASALRAEPTIDMEVAVLLKDGVRLEGVLTTINPDRVTLRVGDALRDIERSKIARMEYEIVLVMRDGQRLVGTLVEQTRDWFTLRIAGVEARVPTETVERIELQKPLRQRYEQMRSLIDDGDVERLLLVAEWLRSVGMFEEAITEVDHVLRVEPFNDRARQLRDLVSRQIEMRDRREQRERERRESAGNSRSAPAEPAPVGSGEEPVESEEQADAAEAAGRRVPLGHRRDFPLLSEGQVNLMKIYELDLRDPPRLLIERSTIDKLLQRFAGSTLLPSTKVERDRFYRKPPEEILDLMFQLQARDLYGEVRVLGGVKSMELFRDHVQITWLLQNCSTSGCHGDANASGLTFHRRRPGSDQSVYTNFLILDRYRTSDGQALINWQTPDRSLLLQMGMNRDNAFRPHPEVKGWRAVFRNPSDRRFRQTVEWIESMYRPRTDAPIEYDPPGESSRAAPAPSAEPMPE